MTNQDEHECIAEARRGLEDGRYESCGGYGCRSHTWHVEELVAAYDALRHRAERAERERDAAIREVGVWSRKTGRAERVVALLRVASVLPSPDLLTDGDWADLCEAVRALDAAEGDGDG